MSKICSGKYIEIINKCKFMGYSLPDTDATQKIKE
jgi:hypothetical protein